MPPYTYISHNRKIIQHTLAHTNNRKITCDLYSTHLCKWACFCKCVWVYIRRGVGEGGEGLLERWKLKIQNGRYFRSTELKQKVCPPFIMTCIAVRALWFALFRCRTKCTHARFPYATTLMAVMITLLWHGKNASFWTIKIKSEHGFPAWTGSYTLGLLKDMHKLLFLKGDWNHNLTSRHRRKVKVILLEVKMN